MALDKTQLARIRSQLVGTSLQNKDPLLYQVIKQLIDILLTVVDEANVLAANDATAVKPSVNNFSTVLFSQDLFEDTFQLLNNITTNNTTNNFNTTTSYLFLDEYLFEDTYMFGSVGTVTTSSSNHYDSPLTDGNVDETDLIFASGECVIVQVPV